MKRIVLAMIVLVAACGEVTTSEETSATSEDAMAYEAPADAAASHDEAAIVCPGDDRCDNVETMPAAQ